MEIFLNAESMMLVMLITVTLGYLARKIGMVDDHFDSVLRRDHEDHLPLHRPRLRAW